MAIKPTRYIDALPAWLTTIYNTILRNGYEVYLVGGALRDLIIGKQSTDYDLATNAQPQQIIALFRRTVLTGIKYGTVTVLQGKKHVEVTTFRSEDGYSDSRHPDSVQFGVSIQADLARRDFTVNAIALNLHNGALVDPFHGRADIQKRVIRAVGDASQRMSEDALRILRGIRFATTLNFRIAKDTMDALQNQTHRLRNVAAERIRMELEKIVESAHILRGFQLLAKINCRELLFHEIADYFCDTRVPSNHSAQCTTLLQQATRLPPRPLHVRLALLYSVVLTTNSAPHTDIDARIRHVQLHLRRLTAPKKTINSIMHLIQQAANIPTLRVTDSQLRRYIMSIGRDLFPDFIRIYSIRYQNSPTITVIDRLSALFATQRVFGIDDLAINGSDLQALGFKEGKMIGAFLQLALQRVCEDTRLNTPQQLKKIAQQYGATHGTH